MVFERVDSEHKRDHAYACGDADLSCIVGHLQGERAYTGEEEDREREEGGVDNLFHFRGSHISGL